MSEYIDRVKLLEKVQDITFPAYDDGEFASFEGVSLRDIMCAPAFDVERVVRCAECIFGSVHTAETGEELYYCKLYKTDNDEKDFCSRGISRKSGIDLERERGEEK